MSNPRNRTVTLEEAIILSVKAHKGQKDKIDI